MYNITDPGGWRLLLSLVASVAGLPVAGLPVAGLPVDGLPPTLGYKKINCKNKKQQSVTASPACLSSTVNFMDLSQSGQVP